MEWQNDPELDRLFKEELDQRVQSLIHGAEAMLSGNVTSEISGQMMREGHTIKGTGRVMGHEAIGSGGETCEFVWRWIQQGEMEPSSMLARALMLLAEALPAALGGDDDPVFLAIDTVRALISDEDRLRQLPNPLVEEDDDPKKISVSGITLEGEFVPDSVGDVGIGSRDALEGEFVPDSVGDVGIGSRDDGGSDPRGSIDVAPPPRPLSVSRHDGLHASRHGSDAAALDALVFEPGPDGRLPTPSITYEIVNGTFDAADSVTGQPDLVPTEMLTEPPSLTLVEEERSILDPETAETYDMGGLVGAVEAWAAEESVPVNAGRLYRMINDVVALRIDLAGTIRQAEQVVRDAEGVSSTAVEGSLEMLDTVRRASVRLENTALGLTMVPLTNITSTLPQLARYLSKRFQRDIELVIEGEETFVDRQMVDRVSEIIRQLVVNALAHGIEDSEARSARGKSALGTVKLALSRNDKHLQIVVADDGSGIDWSRVRKLADERGLLESDPTTEQLRSVLFSDGFSTNPGSTEFIGSGNGLARVTNIVEELFGTMTMESVPGRGTTFVITMPAHRALQRAQIFTSGGHSWGIPESSVLAILDIQDVTVSLTETGSTIGFGSETVPYSSFATVAGLDLEGLASQVIVMQSPTGPIALAVDNVLELHEVATKDLGPLLSGASVVSGVALLGAEETVMLVDPGRLADNLREVEIRPSGPGRSVLIVDDSQGVRQVVSGVLASHGFSTVSAGSVSDALAALAKNTIDAMVVDFSMPRADGVALVHMVRQRYGEIPVVMLSGVASDEDRARAERAGVHAFFDKADFARGALVEKLRDLIDGRAKPGEAEIAS